MKCSFESTWRESEKNATSVYDVFTRRGTRNFVRYPGEKLI